MRETVELLRKLTRRRDDLHMLPQTVARELDMSKLNLQIVLVESEIRTDIANTALIFIDAWEKTGTFTAINEKGERLEARPHVTGAPVQDFWNVRSTALKLAHWSYGAEGYYFL